MAAVLPLPYRARFAFTAVGRCSHPEHLYVAVVRSRHLLRVFGTAQHL